MSSMPYNRLGRTGLQVSQFGLGSWITVGASMDVAATKELIQTAFDAGINYFDNAENYSHGASEEVMGAALAEMGLRRCDLVISTKIFFGSQLPDSTVTARGLSRKHIVEGLRGSLARLRLDYVDVVFAHRPDPEVEIEEIVRAFNWVIDQGLAFYWGTSEWSTAAIQDAWNVADRLGMIGPAVEQSQYNMFKRNKIEREFAPLYASRGLGLTTFSPLAGGILTGKYSGGRAPEGSRLTMERFEKEGVLDKQRAQIDGVERLASIAADLGTDTTILALAWCARNSVVSNVILGCSSVDQLRGNLRVLDVLPKLTDDIMQRIDDLVIDLGDLPLA